MRAKYTVRILKGRFYSEETEWTYWEKPLAEKEFSRIKDAIAFAKGYEQATIPWTAYIEHCKGIEQIATYKALSVTGQYILYKCWYWLSGRRRLYYIRKYQDNLDRLQLLSMRGRYEDRPIYICETPEEMIRYLRKHHSKSKINDDSREVLVRAGLVPG